MTQLAEPFSLLALCARAQGHPAQYEQLQKHTQALSTWDDVLRQAEAHGLEPLLYAHLQAASAALPPHIRQQLQARTMQHAHANHVRLKMLAEILDTFQIAGIQTLVLKGAALAHLVYPHPGLRVMRDMDILVSKSEARRAQAVLAEIGFCAPPPGDNLPAMHLLVAQREVEGMLISVEVHHNLCAKGTPATGLEALRPAAIPFTIDGVTAHTLGPEDLLAHVYRHMVKGAIFQPIRLIWVADLVSLAEHFAAELNWSRVAPCVCNALALFHWLTPLSEELLRAASINVGNQSGGMGGDLGWDFQGWPRSSLAAQREKGTLGILRDTFFPPEWWLRLYYGLGSGPALWWGRMVRHPLHILSWIGDYCAGRVKRQKP